MSLNVALIECIRLLEFEIYFLLLALFLLCVRWQKLEKILLLLRGRRGRMMTLCIGFVLILRVRLLERYILHEIIILFLLLVIDLLNQRFVFAREFLICLKMTLCTLFLLLMLALE